jgi:hypothetical protein
MMKLQPILAPAFVPLLVLRVPAVRVPILIFLIPYKHKPARDQHP